MTQQGSHSVPGVLCPCSWLAPSTTEDHPGMPQLSQGGWAMAAQSQGQRLPGCLEAAIALAGWDTRSLGVTPCWHLAAPKPAARVAGTSCCRQLQLSAQQPWRVLGMPQWWAAAGIPPGAHGLGIPAARAQPRTAGPSRRHLRGTDGNSRAGPSRTSHLAAALPCPALAGCPAAQRVAKPHCQVAYRDPVALDTNSCRLPRMNDVITGITVKRSHSHSLNAETGPLGPPGEHLLQLRPLPATVPIVAQVAPLAPISARPGWLELLSADGSRSHGMGRAPQAGGDLRETQRCALVGRGQQGGQGLHTQGPTSWSSVPSQCVALPWLAPVPEAKGCSRARVWHLPVAALPGSSEDSVLCWASTRQAAGSLLPGHPQGPPVPAVCPAVSTARLAHHCSP